MAARRRRATTKRKVVRKGRDSEGRFLKGGLSALLKGSEN